MRSHLSSTGAARGPPRCPGHPPIQRSVTFCFERHECVAVWASEMCEAVCSEACVSFEGLDRVGEGGRVANFLFTRGLCHLTGDGKNKTMKQMDKNCKLCLVFCLLIYRVM